MTLAVVDDMGNTQLMVDHHLDKYKRVWQNSIKKGAEKGIIALQREGKYY